MITLRMLWIAVAILVGLPLGFGLADHAIGHITVPGGEVVSLAGHTAATVTDIILADPPQTYKRAAVHNWPEQLVEGHTVYVQLLIPLIPDVENFSVDIIGDISCQHHVNASGPYFLGIPIPNRVHEAHVECRFGETVVVTPDPFYDSNRTYQTSMEPTGVEIPFVAPNGIEGVATEYRYWSIEEDWLGVQTAHVRYAWAVPVMDPWVHEDGSLKRWYCPIPLARMEEMGVTHFTGHVVDDPRDAVLAMN